MRNFTHYKLRKHQGKSLVLSKLDYNDIVFGPLPQYLMKRIQRVQNASASFVLGRYANPTEGIVETLRNRTGRLEDSQRQNNVKMSRKTENAQSRATFFRHST